MKKIILLIIVVFSIDNFAQLFPTLGGQRAGISGLNFLKIGVGGRASAMADAFVAISDDASAMYWNPAGIVQSETHQFIFSHNKWFVDINHDFFGAIYHITDVDALGVSITALTMPKMKVTTEFAPFGTGSYFSYSDLAIGASYGRKMTDKFSFGATIKYVEETLDKLKMRGVLVDLGTFYWTGLGTSRFAVSMTNFGNQLAPDGEITLVGKRKKSEWQSFSPPTMFRLGFAFDPIVSEEQKLTASLQLNHPNDNSENISLGAEYSYNYLPLSASFYLRGGYKLNVEEQDFTFGAGVALPIEIARVSFDYSYSNYNRLGAAHRITLLLGIL